MIEMNHILSKCMGGKVNVTKFLPSLFPSVVTSGGLNVEYICCFSLDKRLSAFAPFLAIFFLYGEP